GGGWRGGRYGGFGWGVEGEVTGLIREGDRIVGARGKAASGAFEIKADLVVGADGRHSVVRDRAGLAVEDLGAPMDVFWMRLSRRPDDGSDILGRIEVGRLFVMLNRGDYWQCALVIPKGTAEEVRRKGIEAFREAIAQLVPVGRDRVAELKSFDDVKLLT